MTYHDEARKRLDALPLDADDNTMAAAAADVLLSAHPLPYRIAIDHRVAVLIKDAPERLKEGACLLSYDWRHTNILGIDVMNRDFADRWIRDALCFGYSVSRLSNVVKADYSPISGPFNIADLRLRAKGRAYRAAHPGGDDEVPF